MVVIRDDERIDRLRRFSQYLTLLGLLALFAGLGLAFTLQSQAVLLYQLVALFVGWILSQIGVYLGHRYVRKPRPDEVLDQAVRKVARDGRMYHYVLPVPHVLLLSTGIVLFVTKYQIGEIRAEGNKWKQRGVGLRKFFGQEALGNPSREAEIMVGKLANYLRKQAPSVEEVPIAPVIVFTTKDIKQLDVKNADLPAMHYTKLKGFLRQQRQKATADLSPEDYEAIRAAFDRRASHLVEPDEKRLGSAAHGE